MTYLQLCVKLRERVAERGQGPAAVTSQSGIYLKIVNWINEAYAEIQNKWTDWRFRWYEGTVSTSNGTAEYAMPAAICEWNKDAFYYDDAPIRVLEWEEYRLQRDGWDAVDPGEPSFLVVKPDGTLLVLPTPDATYSIRYEGVQVVDEMTANGDEPIIPSTHHMAIVYKAMMYYGVHQDAPEILAEGSSLYETALDKLEASQLPGQEYRARAAGNDLQITS